MRAEIAMSVSEPLQGKGLASILIAHLARRRGTTTVSHSSSRDVLPENHRMIDVFRHTGFPVPIHAKPGTVEVEFPTEVTDETAEHYEERQACRRARTRSRALLEPRSVAVIGASRDPGLDRRPHAAQPARAAVRRRRPPREPSQPSRSRRGGRTRA